MSTLQLTILAVLALAGLAALRLARVHFNRTPLPDGFVRPFFLFGFVILPPMVLAALTQPAAAAGPFRGLSSVPMYVVIVLTLVMLMAIVALIVGYAAHNRTAQLVRLALIGSEGDPGGIRAVARLTPKLAESVARVDRANAAFPRGTEFLAQVDRAGFRSDWDALDGATRALEAGIADDYRLDMGVAYEATDTAKDARSRLDTLRRHAIEHGQSWAAN
jgi:hypothetical protein